MNKELDAFNRIEQEVNGCICIYHIEENDINIVKQALQRLEAIDNANPSEALKEIGILRGFNKVELKDDKNVNKSLDIIKQALVKAQEQEKENEILKEIIKSLFDKGSPLHQYVDKDFGLTIEVDSECSNMHLGEYKGVDLDNFLKEVLK